MTETQVLIVGGGPVGLTMAALLGRFGIDTVLVERRAGAAAHPRARSINLRTAEIFRQWGILDALVAVSLPEAWTHELIYTESLAGRELGRTRTSTQGIVDGERLSPAPWLLSSQDQFEPIFRRYAETLASVDLRWRCELVDFEATASVVQARVHDLETDAQETIEAAYMIAADGAASAIRRALDIAMEGRHDLATLVNCHFHADLKAYTDDRPAILYWTTEPARNVFQKIDMADRWLCQIGYDPRNVAPEQIDKAFAADWIRRSVGDAGVEVKVIDVVPWRMSSTVAERFRDGRIFLVGDAAHQLPPSGGFGMNTGVQDAHNLAWKLAYVLRRQAGQGLLDSYERERKPVAAYNAARSLENSWSVGRIRKLAEGRLDGDQAEAVAAARRYGNWLGLDLGLRYDAGCLIPDGTDPPAVDDPVSDYRPTARPGHRAPHADIQRLGRPGSTLDLFEDAFVLLAGPDVDPPPTKTAGPPFRSYAFGADLQHPEGPDALCRLYGIAGDGAVLVRPDGHVAARWRRALGRDGSELGDALDRLTVAS